MLVNMADLNNDNGMIFCLGITFNVFYTVMYITCISSIGMQYRCHGPLWPWSKRPWSKPRTPRVLWSNRPVVITAKPVWSNRPVVKTDIIYKNPACQKTKRQLAKSRLLEIKELLAWYFLECLKIYKSIWRFQ